MAYVAARGGENAIEQAERLYREEIGPLRADRIGCIETALPRLIERLMGEASLYAPDLAALALAQSGGDIYEALLLLRAWRTTQPRIGIAEPVLAERCFTHRRVSAAFKDIPGGQILGPTLDYSHRILQTDVLETGEIAPAPVEPADQPAPPHVPALSAWQKGQGLLDEAEHVSVSREDIPDITREPLLFPAKRAHTLQSLARADTGGVLALGYSAMRGYGPNHPTVNEVRLADADLRVRHPDGTVFSAGRVKISQCEVITKSGDSKLKRGFAATFGWNEVKVIAAATLDLNSENSAPGTPTNEEFFLYHTEAVESSGFCIHFKLPHYVTFQSSLDALRDAKKRKPVAEAPPETTRRPEKEDAL